MGRWVNSFQSKSPSITLGGVNYEPREALLTSQYALENPKHFLKTLSYEWEWIENDVRAIEEYEASRPLEVMRKVNDQDLKAESTEDEGIYKFSVTSPVGDDKVKVWEMRDFTSSNGECGEVTGRGVTIYRKDGTEVYLHDDRDDIYIHNPAHPHDVEYAFAPKTPEDKETLVSSGWDEKTIDEFSDYDNFLRSWKE